jgi:hypothetical protein
MTPTTSIDPPITLRNLRATLLAACMMQMEGYYSTKSLAFRNCNPGNIENPDGTMRKWGDPLGGYSALVRDIQVNEGKPLNVFIAKYAPPNENNTSLYLEVVSTLSGIGKDELL